MCFEGPQGSPDTWLYRGFFAWGDREGEVVIQLLKVGSSLVGISKTHTIDGCRRKIQLRSFAFGSAATRTNLAYRSQLQELLPDHNLELVRYYKLPRGPPNEATV